MELRPAPLGALERPAPPAGPGLSPPATDPDEAPLTCPWCDSARVEQVGAIGSHLMVAQYICLACRSPFERIRR